ncbi:tetratricopeptide repeat protein [Caulobacter sp. Root1455]|uniref:tetratricopeptide repeat protein n=1 Tax=Caulobacter sp. Root1455 TaxID=1736465 RepID=UPI0006FF8CF2|nr:tetratricopeptide repeat protein [Caulobacter sp. Root1455]
MTAPRASAMIFRVATTPFATCCLFLAASLSVLPSGPPVSAQTSSQTAAKTWTPPPPAADLQAALDRAATGSPEALTTLADSGRADAQAYAGLLFVMGRGKIAPNPPRGCAYAAKAADERADAMHLRARCLQYGLAGGKPDVEGAKAAYTRAMQMGYPQSKCALGQMLMAEPASVDRGLALCKEAARAGDNEAQLALGSAYLAGKPVTRDPREARKWYEMAVKENPLMAARKLGDLYASGEGGKRDTKKALELWGAAEKAGDQAACILMADQLFSEMTGGRKPGPGTYAFKGGVPLKDIEVVELWYQAALERDPRPEVKTRADYALKLLKSFKTANVSTKKPK